METLKITIDDTVEEKFRKAAMHRFGFGKGALSAAAERAMAEWSIMYDVDLLDTDPVEEMTGLLRKVKKTSVDLQDEVGGVLGKKQVH